MHVLSINVVPSRRTSAGILPDGLTRQKSPAAVQGSVSISSVPAARSASTSNGTSFTTIASGAAAATTVGYLRYHAGKWATCQPFFLSLLAASLPFVVLFGLLGGATIGRTALAYGLLYAYANLLLLVTMGLMGLSTFVVGLLPSYASIGVTADELVPARLRVEHRRPQLAAGCRAAERLGRHLHGLVAD